jgi:hypothetical protein
MNIDLYQNPSVGLTPIFFIVSPSAYNNTRTAINTLQGDYLIVESPETTLDSFTYVPKQKFRYDIPLSGEVELLLAPGKYYKVNYFKKDTDRLYNTQYWNVPRVFRTINREIVRSNFDEDLISRTSLFIYGVSYNSLLYEPVVQRNERGTTIVWPNNFNGIPPGSLYTITFQDAVSLRHILDKPGYLS